MTIHLQRPVWFGLALLASCIVAPVASAQTTYYWDSNGTTLGAGVTPTGTWGSSNFWNTDSTGGAAGLFTSSTLGIDSVFFSAGTDAVNAYTVSLNSATQNARLVTFEDGTVTLSTGTLSLGGGGGITLATTTVTGATISSGLTITGNQSFNVAASRTLTLNTGSFTRNAGATLNVLNTGTVTTTMTNLATGSLVNNIIGPWATFNTGASTTYATINGSNNIVGLGYTGGADGVAPGAAAIVTDTTGALSYSLNVATGTLGTNASINTLRSTTAASTLTTATSFTTNGILNAGTGLLTISGNVTIGATKELVLNAASNNISITNNIVNNGGGASALIVTGTGSTTLNGLGSTYSGGTFVNQGSLSTGATGNITDTYFGNSSGTVTVNSGATLALNRTYVPNLVALNNATLTSGNSFASTLAGGVVLTGPNTLNVTGGLTISSNFTGSGTLTKTGASTITFVSGTNYNAGALTISGGVVGFGNAASLFGGTSATWTPANITVASGAALGLRYGGVSDFTSGQVASIITNLTTVSNNGLRDGSFIGFDTTSGNATYSGVITDSTGTGGGSVGLNKSGGNTLIVSGANTFSGPVSIGGLAGQNGGTLSVSSFNSVSSPVASSSLGRPTTQTNGTITLGNASAASSAGITYTGTGETTDRILVINLGGGGFTLDQSGTGLLKFTSNVGNSSSGARTATLQGSTAGTGEIAGILADAGAVGTNALSIVKAGTGTWTLSGANIYSGTTTVSAGTLIVSNSLGLQNSAIVTTGAGTLSFTGLTATPTIGGLSGATGNLATVLGSAGVGYSSVTGLTLNIVAGSLTYGGVIANGASGMTLTKIGGGTQILSGANTYTGLTTIRNGTLTIGSGTAGSLNGTTGTPLTFIGTGGFNVAEATGSNQGMGTLTVNAGDATITSTASGASNAATLTFASFAGRTAGTTVNFVIATNITATTNKIVLSSTTNAPLSSSGSNNQGIFFGTSEYARYDTTTGNFRAVTYGTDSNALATVATGATIGTIADATKDVKITGAITAQNSNQINTLNIGANTLTFQATASTLNVNGILGSTGSIANGTNASSLQTTAADGELVIYNSGAMTIAANIIANGNSSVTKSGAGTLTLTGTSTYTGGTVLNAGILSFDSATNIGGINNTGGSTASITVNGNSTISMPTNNLIANFGTGTITIAGGATLTVSSASRGDLRFGGAVTGSGGLTATSGSFWSKYSFNSTANTFTGAITDSRSGNDGIANAALSFNSIADGAGYGNIILNAANDSGIDYGSGAIAPLTLNNRQIVLANNNTVFFNNASSQAVNINTDIGFIGTGARQIRFGISGRNGTGISTIAGKLTDNVGGAFTPTFNGGTWVLTGSNTYSGTTTVSGGTLASTAALQGFGTNLNGISIGGSATLSLRNDSNVSFTNGTSAYNIANSATGATINVDRVTGTGTNTITVGNLTTSSTAATWQLNFTGANGVSLSAGALTTPTAAAGANTISNSITGGGSLTLASITGGGTGATSSLAFTGNGNTIVTGAITQTATAQSLSKSGTGTLTLNGTSSYTGITTITAGTVEAFTLANGGSTSSIGASSNAAASLVFGAPTATLRYIGTADITIDRGFTTSSTAGGGATIESSGTGTLSFNNTVAIAYQTAAQTRSLTLGGTNTGVNTFGKLIANNTSGLTSVTKTGVGTWVLSTANTYTGTTTVSAGTLLINGNQSAAIGAISVASGATLGGSGTLGGTVNVSSGGTLQTGNSPGILTANAAVTLTSGSTFAVNINGTTAGNSSTNYGQLVVASGSSINLGGATLSALFGSPYIDALSGANVGDKFYIVNTVGTATLTGQFASLTQDAVYIADLNSSGLSVQISYTGDFGTNAISGGNDVVLYVSSPIPEPTTVLLLCAAGAFGYRGVRRKYARG